MGSDTPSEKSKNTGFLIKTGPVPLKKAQSYEASVHCWAIIVTLGAKRHLNGVSLAGR